MKVLPNHVTNLSRMNHAVMAVRRNRGRPELLAGEYAPVSYEEAELLHSTQDAFNRMLDSGWTGVEFTFAFLPNAGKYFAPAVMAKSAPVPWKQITARAVPCAALYDVYDGFEVGAREVNATPGKTVSYPVTGGRPKPPAKLNDVDALNRAYNEQLKLVEIERTREAQRLRDRMYYSNR